MSNTKKRILFHKKHCLKKIHLDTRQCSFPTFTINEKETSQQHKISALNLSLLLLRRHYRTTKVFHKEHNNSSHPERTCVARETKNENQHYAYLVVFFILLKILNSTKKKYAHSLNRINNKEYPTSKCRKKRKDTFLNTQSLEVICSTWKH